MPHKVNANATVMQMQSTHLFTIPSHSPRHPLFEIPHSNARFIICFQKYYSYFSLLELQFHLHSPSKQPSSCTIATTAHPHHPVHQLSKPHFLPHSLLT